MAWTLQYLKDSDNLIRGGSIFVDSTEYTEDSSYPKENLLMLPVSKTARFTAIGATAGVHVTIPNEEDVTVIAIVGHNLSESATVTVYGGDTYPAATSLGTMTWRRGLLFLSFSTAKNYLFYKIEITDDANEYGFHEFGYLVFGALSSLSYGFFSYSISDNFGVIESSRINSNRRPVNYIQSASLQFTNQTIANASTLRTLYQNSLGSATPVLVIPDSTANEAVFGRLDDTFTLSRVSSGSSPLVNFGMTVQGEPISIPKVEPLPYYRGGDSIPSDWTFSRDSVAYYKNDLLQLEQAAPGAARTSHYASYGVRGLLLENSSTNLKTHSETTSGVAYSNASGQGDAYAEPKASPSTRAIRVMESTATGTHYVRSDPAMSLSAGTTRSVSFFVKANGRNYLRVYFLDTEDFGFTLDLSTGTYVGPYTLGGTLYGYQIEKFYDGWYRIKFSGIVGASRTAGTVYVLLGSTSSTFNYAGDGSSGIYIWGIQIEEAPFPTSYIETAASAVSRSGDSLYSPWTAGVIPLTAYVDTVDNGGFLAVSGQFVTLGYDSESVFQLYSVSSQVTTTLEFDSGTPETSTATGVIAAGDCVEALGAIYQGFSHKASVSLSGSTQSDGSETSALAYDGQDVNRMYINRAAEDSTKEGSRTYKSIKIHRGVQTLDFMRKL